MYHDLSGPLQWAEPHQAASSARRAICDDAHVAELMMRDAFTLKITPDHHPAMLTEIVELFGSHFEELGRAGDLREAVAPKGPTSLVAFAMPNGIRTSAGRLLAILGRHGAADDDHLKYVYPHLRTIWLAALSCSRRTDARSHRLSCRA